MDNPINYFFKLGDKVTRGDPIKKCDWDYYLLWVMFLAFFSIFLDNLMNFYNTLQLKSLGWAFVMLAIMWFQYFGLKTAYDVRKMIKKQVIEKPEPKEEMLKEFNELSEETKQ